MRTADRHAVVIGASMGGLAAARVLAEFYCQVTLIERDTLSDRAGQRKGVPHGRHAHGLLARGLAALEGWFPGVTGELVAKGALTGDLLAHSVWFNHGVALARCDSGLTGLLLSRPLLEGHVRRRLLKLPNVQIFDRCQAEPVFDRRRGAVTGVEIRRPQPGAREILPADLIVDATGRNSRSPAWLEGWGFPPPQEEQVEVGITYTTRLYRRRPDHAAGNRVVVVRSQAPHYRFGVALAQEFDSWIVTLGGYLGDAAPNDEAGFRAYTRSLPSPEIHAIVSTAEPLSPFRGFRFAASQRRRYERLDRFPPGYLVIGDALSSFNPAYGQGMTAALLEADALADCLMAPGTQGLARRFFARAARIIDRPWQIAVGGDLANPNVEAERPLTGRLLNWYIGRLYRAGAGDPYLARRFIEVANLMAPPASLLAPATVLRTLRGNLARVSGGVARPSTVEATGREYSTRLS